MVVESVKRMAVEFRGVHDIDAACRCLFNETSSIESTGSVKDSN